jgi:hypothetical protein
MCRAASCRHIVILQKVAGSVTRAQEERRKVQGGVLKSMKELEAKCGLMKSSKVRGFLNDIRCVFKLRVELSRVGLTIVSRVA